MWNKFKTFDPWLYGLPFVLLVISVAVIYSLTINSIGSGLFIRQGLYALLGIVLMGAITFLDYRSLKSWWVWIYSAGVILLLLVKFAGKSDFGAQRWINLGFFQLQPAELEKLIIIIALGALLTRTSLVISNSRFALILAVLLIPVIEVIAQPDLGTAIVIAVTGIGMIVHAKISKVQRGVILVGLMLIIASFSLSFKEVAPFKNLLKEYQKDRLLSFIDPKRDAQKTGYNIQQSVIAVGSGGVTGKGLGFGSQSQLNFLPVAHADFIFAGISEAWGLVGSWGIISLYVFLLYRILLAARIAKDNFGMILCIGVIIKILVEVLVNVGMNIQLMPVTGIPLPFLSYGGTTLLTNALAIGIVQSVVIRYKRLTF